jgi:hypothetical protein|tara:strand:- start:244 stop:348 length:105 start_codon:yes stop_codon:yes gene_type:complete
MSNILVISLLAFLGGLVVAVIGIALLIFWSYQDE